MASDEADVVIDRLGLLGSGLRAQGSRVGVGELLTAHRALAAVDCALREEARLALRTVLCANRADLERFDRVFSAVFDQGLPLGTESAGEQLALIERVVLPRAGSRAVSSRTRRRSRIR